MKLLRLYIIKSGIFQKTVIDFTDKSGKPQDLICLAGVNGAGKTSIMELITNLMWFLNPKLTLENIAIDRLKPNILTRTEFAQLDIFYEGKILSLVLGDESHIQKSSEYEQMLIIEKQIASILKEFEEVVKSSIPHNKKDQITIKGTEYFEKKFFNRNITQINNQLFAELFQELEKNIGQKMSKNNSLPFVYYFDADDRKIQDIRYRSIPEDNPIYELVQRYHSEDNDIKKLLVYYDYAYTQEFEKLKEWVNAKVLDNKRITRIDRTQFKVVIQTDNGEHGMELLSSGEESLLIMAIQLYLNASPNSVILIDEVDQSLHPQYQEKMMQLVKKIQQQTNCQIIVSSHSEFIWHEFDEQAIIDLTRR